MCGVIFVVILCVFDNVCVDQMCVVPCLWGSYVYSVMFVGTLCVRCNVCSNPCCILLLFWDAICVIHCLSGCVGQCFLGLHVCLWGCYVCGTMFAGI